MIDRYTLPEMGKIWSDQNRYQQMLQVELYACEAMRDLGLIPSRQYEEILETAEFDLNRIYELNETTKHDLVSFISSVNEHLSPENALIFHKGMTSSDVLDTALSTQMVQSAELLLGKLYQLQKYVQEKAITHKYTLMIGRTHGMHAEPITFGHKLALWHEDLKRSIELLKHAKAVIAVGQVSGSVGNYANINPLIEDQVCRKLGLRPELVSTQIIQRDRHATFVSAISLVGCTLDKIATELRNLQRSEIAEVYEPLDEGQAGSSGMPHKRNPILCERVSGLARILRGNVVPAMENVTLWHERDLSHSSVERIIIPESCILLDQMLSLLITVISKLQVKEDKMRENIEDDLGLIFSQQVFLALLDKGVKRNRAYKMVKRNAFTCVNEGIDFEYLVLQDDEIMALLSREELENMFNYDYYTKNIDYIFSRIGIELPQ